MNIKEAKEYIKDSVRIYLKKDEEGEYRIPVVRQRPIFLLGAPGIGKTAIMEQIAQELGIALVSYSMTHHTRQSALGLPFIVRKTYGGEEYEVSEYTMSEILASIYDVMEASGIREGILFLDEINCVSETLAPSMLQFLQYKVFGRHRVPDGWVIVTAGNPPEYNKSVREFDIVTMDRLKILSVEADYSVWKEYAVGRGLHAAILNYLDLKKDDFYQVETTVKGRRYVTARGWEDLSQMLILYEEEGIAVEESLVGQYLRDERVVKEFCAYYDLYRKYRNDYRAEEILSGTVSEQAKDKARKADFDERLSLMGMLIDKIRQEIRENILDGDILNEVMGPLRALKAKAAESDAKNLLALLTKQREARQNAMDSLRKAGALSARDKKKSKAAVRFLSSCEKTLKTAEAANGGEAFALLERQFNEAVAAYREKTETVQKMLHFLFQFVEDTFGSGNEMLLLMTECTVQEDCAKFISLYGSEDYRRHNEELMLTERGDDLLEKIEALKREMKL
ncbi:MAG: AAA family ATPase [Bacteroidales bacterium]|nr:AAA family ATPase [Bacteroidales bacterium]MCM1416518.1 AAA family ATPase [bacterium]MCM1424496.1 AAA family ATPase [bacterium]